MDYLESFQNWVNYFSKHPEYKSLSLELDKISESDNEIKERFSTNLEFGTAGLRGIMGVGTNRLNIFTIRKASQGLSDYLLSKFKSPSVSISFDSRLNSNTFAKEAAMVFAANGIKVYITKELAPTPFLSFSVRELSCQAGIMITASHNPAEYNGYKCYSEDGAQMSTKCTAEVYNYIEKIDIFKDVLVSDFDEEISKGKIEFISNQITDRYIKNILSKSINKEYPSACSLDVTYTPLNGAGKFFVEKVLYETGVNKLHIVKEQENPDGNFPTCKYPNPETKESFKLAIDYANKYSSDLVIATDPDSDRLGAWVLHDKNYLPLSGNQIGILLFNYILSQRKNNNSLPKNPVAIRTIVSSRMVDIIAKDYGCNIICVPTGFKYIGEKINELESKNSLESFIFGFEESNGYLSGTYTRDKDAVLASMLMCEMTSFYKKQNLTLIDVLNSLNNKYGFYKEKTISFEFKDSNGLKTMSKIMDYFRAFTPQNLGGIDVICNNDYNSLNSLNIKSKKITPINFYKINIIELILQNNNSVIIRPSGTEPKLKIYIMTTGKTKDMTESNLNDIEKDICLKIKELS